MQNVDNHISKRKKAVQKPSSHEWVLSHAFMGKESGEKEWKWNMKIHVSIVKKK